MSDDCTERPTQREDSTWDALDSHGYGHVLGFKTEWEVEVWLMGYETGTRENM